MDLSGLTEYIDLFISNEDVEHPKPSPEMFLKAMSKFKVEPRECLIIEDNENGFKAAEESGAFLMKVSNPEDVQLQKIDNVINEINGLTN